MPKYIARSTELQYWPNRQVWPPDSLSFWGNMRGSKGTALYTNLGFGNVNFVILPINEITCMNVSLAHEI